MTDGRLLKNMYQSERKTSKVQNRVLAPQESICLFPRDLLGQSTQFTLFLLSSIEEIDMEKITLEMLD